MAKGINKVILVGRLGQDPETRYMPNGNPVTNISVATSESWKDQQTGIKQERTEWHRVVFFARLAEIAMQYLGKGDQVYIEGRIETKKWTDQSGQDRYTTHIVANQMQMLGSKQDNSASSYEANATRTQTAQPASQGAAGRPSPPPDNQPMGVHQAEVNFDDDISF